MDTSPLTKSKFDMLRMVEMAVLDEREWDDFIKRVKAEENIKVPLVPTPKLEKAAESVRLYARGVLNGHNNSEDHWRKLADDVSGNHDSERRCADYTVSQRRQNRYAVVSDV